MLPFTVECATVRDSPGEDFIEFTNMKKKALLKLIFYILIVPLFYGASCRKNNCRTSYTIKNKSIKAIYFGTAYDSSFSRLDYNPGLSPSEFKCEPNSEKTDFSIEGSCIDGEVNSFGLHIFIFDADIIESTAWNTIKQNRLLIKRFDLTMAQLDSCNWVITYP